MATSADWNVIYRPWLTTLAPIFTSFSHSVVNDQCSKFYGSTNVSCGSGTDLRQYRRNVRC